MAGAYTKHTAGRLINTTNVRSVGWLFHRRLVRDLFRVAFFNGEKISNSFFSSQIVTTGGDDGRLKIWDRRCGTAVPTMTNRRHTAGVTFVSRLHNNTSDQLLLTGSYDEYVRLTDTRQFNATVAEICLG
jgi:WD40 repeat protein